MIFVTVGTHEQPFNRLVKKIDELKGNGTIQDDVFIQTGFSTYEPKNCQWSKLIPYQQMVENVEDARIVITHGGPASFIMPLQIGKTPIVVPRQHQFNEHVNDHQVEFARNVAQRMGTIIPVAKTLSRRESWEKYKRDIAAYNKMAEKYHASKFAEVKRYEEGDYFVSNWSKYSQRPRRALRNLPEKNHRMFTNFVKVYDAMGAAGNEEAAYIARMLRQFYLNDEVAFIQILNDAAKGENELEYIHMFASTTQEKDNALQSFTEIYDVFGKDKYGELAIKPYNSRTIED